MATVLDDTLIKTLQCFDTPTVCNALELLVPQRRGYGFTTSQLVCTRPELPPMIGYARTATIRAAHPSDLSGKEARALSDGYYEYIDRGPKPSIAVIQDLDGNNGYGCLWGEVNSNIHKGLGCQGVITDGGVRDVPDIAPGFQMLAASVLPSHAFVHVVFGGGGRRRRMLLLIVGVAVEQHGIIVGICSISVVGIGVFNVVIVVVLVVVVVVLVVVVGSREP